MAHNVSNPRGTSARNPTIASSSRWSTSSDEDSDNTTRYSQHNPPAPDLSSIRYHYANARDRSLKLMIDRVSEDLLSHEVLHDWDESLSPDLVKSLANFVKSQLARKKIDRGDYMVNFHRIQEVSTVDGLNVMNHMLKSDDNATARLFPCFQPKTVEVAPECNRQFATNLNSQGRVVELREHIDSLSRCTLFLLHTFSLRLVDEDVTFIRNFVFRHLLAEPMFKEPSLFQDVAPSEDQGICYKRLTMSFHLSHLLLQADAGEDPTEFGLDRQYLGLFAPTPSHLFGDTASNPSLFQASSSVLLTLVVPEIQPSRREEQCLLETPQARWTVIVVNGSWQMASASSTHPVEYQSPIAQFVRGICGTVVSQRVNAVPIVQNLKERLDRTENDSLFDDEQFTKSRVYNWAIRMCRQLSDSIHASLRFLKDVQTNRLPRFVSAAHPYEKPGLEFWNKRLRDEIHELEGLLDEIKSLREHACESREALHGASGLLASRMSLAQNNNLKALTYLSVACLPLGTVSSIFGIEVLPEGATFTSFLAAIIIFTAANIVLALHLQNMVVSRTNKQQQSPGHNSEQAPWVDLVGFLSQVPSFIMSMSKFLWIITRDFYVDALSQAARLAPYRAFMPPLFVVIAIFKLLVLVVRGSYFIMFKFSLKELEYDLRLLSRPVSTHIFPVTFSYWKLATDIVRFALIPVWLALLVIPGVLMLLFGICYGVWWLLAKCFSCVRSRC